MEAIWGVVVACSGAPFAADFRRLRNDGMMGKCASGEQADGLRGELEWLRRGTFAGARS